MRAFVIVVVVLGLGILACALDPVRTKLSSVTGGIMGTTAEKATTAPTAAAGSGTADYFVDHDGSVWRRMPDGTTQVWQNKKWVRASAAQELTAYKPEIENQSALAATHPVRRYSRDPDAQIGDSQDNDQDGSFKANPFSPGDRDRLKD
jgi:hypothetical protein